MKKTTHGLALLLLLGACATSSDFKFGQAKLIGLSQQKLEQQFTIGVTRFADVKLAFGKCYREHFLGDYTQEDRSKIFADLAAGRNLSCSYHYVEGKIPSCAEASSCNALSVGLDKYHEITAIFLFDENGRLALITYNQNQNKRPVNGDNPDVTQKSSASDVANEAIQ